MNENYKIIARYVKDMSSETPDVETYIFVKDHISKYQLLIDINSKPLKNKMVEIEKILVSEFGLDEDLLWDTAMRKYDQDYSIIDLMESTGTYTEDGNRVGMIALLGFDTVAKEVLGSKKTKDF